MAESVRGKVLPGLYRPSASFVFRTALLSASLLTRAGPSGAPAQRTSSPRIMEPLGWHGLRTGRR